MAALKVAETQARDVQIGEPASVDTHNGVIAGTVMRVDPAVQNGTVTVDVKLTGELPKGARPDLSVDGTIDLEQLDNVLYVGRPAFGQENSTISLFKLDRDGHDATARSGQSRTGFSEFDSSRRRVARRRHGRAFRYVALGQHGPHSAPGLKQQTLQKSRRRFMTDASQPLIQITDMTKVFYTDEIETHALSGVHLSVAKGEYVAMSGPSGCGKSTLLSIIGLLDTPTGGRYLLNDKPVENLDFAERARIRNQEIGFIFQSFNLIGDLTVYENVELPLTYRQRMPSAERKTRVMEALERVGMAHRVRHYPSQLSGGQQQRVAVARALGGKPSILLADEPTGNLDSRNGEAVMELLADLHREGATICMVTHDPRFAKHAQREVHLFDGKVVAEEELKKLMADAHSMSGLLQDVRYALRQLRKSPGFTAVAVLTLALGIGANTAVFSVMSAVLFRMMPVQDPQRLYYLKIATGNQPPGASNTGNSDSSFSEPVFEALRQRRDVLDDVVAYVPLGIGKVAVRYGEIPEEAAGDEVSGNFFSGLTAQVLQGRGFSQADEADHAQVTVISYDYWTRRFSRDPAVLGKTLFIKNVPFTIIGIAARGFQGVEPASSTDFWIPLQNRPELNAWGNPSTGNNLYGTPKWWCLPLMARLRPHVTPIQAANALQSTFGEAAKTGVGTIDPKLWKPVLAFDPAIGIEGYNQQYREPVRILMGLVFLVLLIACTNVALLIMARNEVRQREFSLRMAVGAERVHLFRQLLTESSLLVTAGAGLGWAFALMTTRALAAWSGIETGLEPDRNVLLFTLGISVISALVFGLAPLFMVLRVPVSGVLRATAKNITQGRHRSLAGRIVMSSQVAICLLVVDCRRASFAHAEELRDSGSGNARRRPSGFWSHSHEGSQRPRNSRFLSHAARSFSLFAGRGIRNADG